MRLIYRNIRVNTDVASLTILIGLPAMYLIFFGYGFQSLASGSSYLSFLTPGIMAFQAVMAGTVGGSMLWADRRWGMLAQLLVGPFSRLEYLLGIMFTAVIFGLAGALLMLGVAYLLLHGIAISPLMGLAMLGTIALGSIFFGSLLLYISARVKSNNTYNSIQVLTLFFVNFASTVFYPLSGNLPAVLHALFLVNPLTYVADTVRGAAQGQLTATNGLEMIVLSAETVVALVFAVRAYLRSDVSME